MSRIISYLKDSTPDSVKSFASRLLPNFFLAQFRANDLYILSFPKCGRTWLKLLLCDMVYYQFPNATRVNDVSTHVLYKVHDRIPRIIFSHDNDPHYKRPDELFIDKKFYNKSKVIFLVRDPRDVVVSWYYEYKNRVHENYKDKMGRIDDTSLSQFMRSERGSLKTIVSFYNLWFEQKSIPSGFKIVKYEELKFNSLKEVMNILEFAEMNTIIEEKVVKKALDHNEFSKVQLREKRGEFKLGNISNELGSTNVSSNENLKARKGKVGDYKNHFSEEDISYMNAYIEQNLNPVYNY